jgi:hypothetical protein
VIPINVLKKKNLQELMFKYQDRFDFNGIDNAIPLPKKSMKYEQTGHANHPKYDDVITTKIDNIFENSIDDNDAFENIKKSVIDIRKKLENDVLLGNRDVNNLMN